MAKRRTVRRAVPRDDRATTAVETPVAASLDASIIPRLLVGTVNGVEALALGALQVARSVLLTVVSGVVDLGTQTVSASAGVARSSVTAVSGLAGELGGVAQRTVEATVASAQNMGTAFGDALRAPRTRSTASTAMLAAHGSRSTEQRGRRPLIRRSSPAAGRGRRARRAETPVRSAA
jgi:hypothetical protein